MNDKRLLDYYQTNFSRHGVHEKSLGWTKGKQRLRFHQLTKNFDLSNASLLDVGCGFGDFNQFLGEKGDRLTRYVGIDVVPEFIQTAKARWKSAEQEFVLGNYLETQGLEFDYVIASGVFGLALFDQPNDQYAYIERVLRKAFIEARVGISFDFISDRTDFRSGGSDFHATPSRILDIAYSLSRNVLLDNSAMPFEFSITVFKDDSFKAETTVFNRNLVAYSHFLDRNS